jgi:hypothetical protein
MGFLIQNRLIPRQDPAQCQPSALLAVCLIHGFRSVVLYLYTFETNVPHDTQSP